MPVAAVKCFYVSISVRFEMREDSAILLKLWTVRLIENNTKLDALEVKGFNNFVFCAIDI